MNDKTIDLENEAARYIRMMADDSAEVQVNTVCDLVAVNPDLIVTRAFGEWTVMAVRLLGNDGFEAVIKRRKHEAPRI